LSSTNQTLLELQSNCQERPNNVESWIQLGTFFLKNNDPVNAFDAYKKALELDESNINTWFNIGNCYSMNDEPEKAEEIYTLIINANQHQSSVWHNLGYAYKKQKKLAQALYAFEIALRYGLEEAGNHLSYALMQLALGNYEIGFHEYEWRWVTALNRIHFDKIPLWHGENLQGKRLLVIAEQGFGDSFQFMRYLKILYEEGITIIFQCQKAVAPLAKLCPYIQQVLTKDEIFSGNADAHICLMSIPYILKTDIETIPHTMIPYLFTNPERDSYWSNQIKNDKNFKIGFCFQANDLFATAQFQTTKTKKSIPIELLEEIISMKNCSWFCLEKNSSSFDNFPSVNVFDSSFDNDYGSFIDSASVIKCLDLVITVDTAIAHLAGALGVPTIVLVTFVPDWRWLYDRNDSPWYPKTTYLLRQTALNNWSTIVAPLKNLIKKIITSKEGDLDVSYD